VAFASDVTGIILLRFAMLSGSGRDTPAVFATAHYFTIAAVARISYPSFRACLYIAKSLEAEVALNCPGTEEFR
jgi:hypothetical protein